MQIYIVTLAVGILVGIVYGLLGVRSPAPPVIALLGLMGILIGEQVVPIAKRLISGEGVTVSWLKSDCGQHVFGELPGKKEADRRPV